MLRFTVMPGLPDVLCATPNTSSKYAAMKPPCTQAGAPSNCLVNVTVPTTMALPSSDVTVSTCIGAAIGLMAPMTGLRSRKLTDSPDTSCAMSSRMVCAMAAFSSSSGVIGTWRT